MKKVIGIMGPGKANDDDLINAYEIGKYCAKKGYAVLTGGLNIGVMNEALKGAKENGGITVGVLPIDDRTKFSEYIDIPIITTMKAGRNYINVLSSDIIIACGIEAGTSSEISMAIKADKKVILVGLYDEANIFYSKLTHDQILITKDYIETIEMLENIFVKTKE